MRTMTIVETTGGTEVRNSSPLNSSMVNRELIEILYIHKFEGKGWIPGMDCGLFPLLVLMFKA
jgi:hypothetical protein